MLGSKTASVKPACWVALGHPAGWQAESGLVGSQCQGLASKCKGINSSLFICQNRETMTDQEQKSLEQKNYTKKQKAKIVTFQFDDASKNKILESIPNNIDEQIVANFIAAIQSEVGTYKELMRQKTDYQSESNKLVNNKIKKACRNITALIRSLDEISQSDEILNRLHIILKSSISHEDQIKAMNDGSYHLMQNLVNDTLYNLKQDLTGLNNNLIIAEEFSNYGNKLGRPNKDLRANFIRKFADTYNRFLGNATTTRNAPFESIVETCLNAAGEYISDIHDLIVDALKST